MLGFKGLAWRGVEQPPILPKPKLAPLTGGYRRIPVLQEGADLWCDTRLIARELERRVPSPDASFPPATAAPPRRSPGGPSTSSCGRRRCSSRASMPTTCRAGLHEDRARLHGLPPPSIEAVRKAAVRNLHLVRPQIQWLADMLHDGRPYLLGERALHRRLRRLSRRLVLQGPPHRLPRTSSPYPRLLAWRDRMAAIGHGQRTDIDPARGAGRGPRRRARAAASLAAAGRRSPARRARPRAAGRQCQGLGRGRGEFRRRRRDRAAAPRSRRRPGRRALPAAGLRLAARLALEPCRCRGRRSAGWSRRWRPARPSPRPCPDPAGSRGRRSRTGGTRPPTWRSGRPPGCRRACAPRCRPRRARWWPRASPGTAPTPCGR